MHRCNNNSLLLSWVDSWVAKENIEQRASMLQEESYRPSLQRNYTIGQPLQPMGEVVKLAPAEPGHHKTRYRSGDSCNRGVLVRNTEAQSLPSHDA